MVKQNDSDLKDKAGKDKEKAIQFIYLSIMIITVLICIKLLMTVYTGGQEATLGYRGYC